MALIHEYGKHVTDFKVGDRVAISPSHDLWMAGVRYGTVSELGDSMVLVSIEYGVPYSFAPSHLRVITTNDREKD